MANIERRLGALEDYINQLIAERMEKEVEALVNLLAKHLIRDEFTKVVRIVVEEGNYGA